MNLLTLPSVRVLRVDVRGRVSEVAAAALTADPEAGATNALPLAAGELLQIDWPNARPVHEFRLRCTPPGPGPNEVFLSWWRANWPVDRAGTRAAWEPVTPAVSVAGDELLVRFPPLTTNEVAGAALTGLRFRQTRALRLSFARDVVLRRAAVHSDAALQEARLRFEWGLQTSTPGRWSPEFSVFGGRLLERREAGRRAAELRLLYAHPEDPLSPDRGRVEFRSGTWRSFAVPVADVLATGGLFVRDVGVFVSDPARIPDFAHWTGPDTNAWQAGTVLEQAARLPEELFVRDLASAAADFHAPAILSLPGVRQDFLLRRDGAVVVRRAALRTPGADRDARPWRWPELCWRMGIGASPGFDATRRDGTRAWADDGLPILRQSWPQEGLEWSRESFVAPLASSFAALTNVQGAETTVLGCRYRVRNPGPQPRETTLWLVLEPAAPVHLTPDGTLILPVPSDGVSRPGVVPVRGRLAAPEDAELGLALLPGRPEAGTAASQPAVRCRLRIPPGGEQVIDLWIPGVELLTPPELAALKQLDFSRLRAEAAAFWETQLATAGQMELPVPRLGGLFRANLARLLAALERDPVTGEWHVGPAAVARRVSLEELALISRRLAQAGHPAAADRLLAPVLARQGQEAPAGGHSRTAGAFAAQAEDPDPFAASAPVWQHAAFVQRLTDPTFPPAPAGWAMSRALSGAAEWIASGREANGLFLPGPVRTGGGWGQAFATDGANIRALRQVADWFAGAGNATAARQWRETAEAYADTLHAALARAVGGTPVVRLRDGRWIPGVPWRVGALMNGLTERREEIAASSLRLVSDGVLPADDPFTDWLLQQLEDNLLLGGLRRTTANGSSWTPAAASPAPATLDLAHVYLLRDQIGLVWRTLRNLLATRFDPETLTLAAPGPGAPPDELAAECRFLTQLRETLVRETANRLDLCAGVPRAWLDAGRGFRLRRFPTAFGLLDLDATPPDGGQPLRVHVRLVPTAPPDFVRLRLRPPAHRVFREVRVNGRRVRLRDDWLELPTTHEPVWEVEARL